MYRHILLLIFTFFSFNIFAQTPDTLPPVTANRGETIAECRKELLQSFLQEDPAGASLWMDSLARLEDEQYAGLIWDERWLLYYWMESYGTLLEELGQYDEHSQALQSWKTQPPRDSLFEWIDFVMNEKRFEAFGSIGRAFLNEEEKAFTTILFEYLLRLKHEEEEWAARLESFENHYPTSRFLKFVRSIKPAILKPANKALGISGGLQIGNWNGDIERALNTPYAFNFDAYYWVERWNFIVDFAAGGPRLRRDLFAEGEIWPKDDPTSFLIFGLGLGYDVVNKPKLRIFPSIGGGLGILKPPTPDEEEEPLPDYYDAFNFHEFHLSAALNLDVKLFQKNYRNWNTPKGSYHGVRLKFGINRLTFGKQNEGLRGHLLFFAINYNFFAHLTKK